VGRGGGAQGMFTDGPARHGSRLVRTDDSLCIIVARVTRLLCVMSIHVTSRAHA
jgi:hypothetical protein